MQKNKNHNTYTKKKIDINQLKKLKLKIGYDDLAISYIYI